MTSSFAMSKGNETIHSLKTRSDNGRQGPEDPAKGITEAIVHLKQLPAPIAWLRLLCTCRVNRPMNRPSEMTQFRLHDTVRE